MKGELPATGAIIADRYCLIALIGEGGMGQVWRARDEKLARHVAVKVLPARALGDATARARLLREARTAGGLNHPGIAHVYDVGETPDGGAYLVMELLEGATLRALLKDDGFSLAGRLDAAVQAARALAAAHQAGLVHRDVKPDNLMLRDDGRVAVLDFGIAKPSAGELATEPAVTGQGVVLGTPAYLSPEQARGEAIDARSDQFSLGVTLFELLARRLPWRTEPPIAVISSILSDPPPPLVLEDELLSGRLDAVLRRALAKRPEDRYPDLDELASALVAASGELVASVASSKRKRSSPPSTARTQSSTPVSSPAALARTEVAPTTHSETVGSRKRRGALVVASLAVVGAAALGALFVRARRNPLAVDDAVLACVVWEGRDRGAPAGWLGAAAASRFCDYAAPSLGGTYRHVRFPADLLGLARTPTDDFPEDPFEAADARSRSIAEARRRGLPYADGSIEATDDGFRATVSLHASTGRELGSTTAVGETIGEAVGAAMDALAATRALPERAALDADYAAWFRIGSVRAAELSARLELESDAPLERICAAMGPPPPGRTGSLQRAVCSPDAVESDRADEPRPRADDDAGWVELVLASGRSFPEADVAALRSAVDRAIARTSDRSLRARALLARSWLLGQTDGAGTQATALAAADADPRGAAAFPAAFDTNVVRGTSDVGPRVASAWRPDDAQSWRARGLTAPPGDAESRAKWTGRAFKLRAGPDAALFYADSLLALRRPEAARAVAARLAVRGRPLDVKTANFIIGRALGAEGRLGAAYDRLLSLLLAENVLFPDGSVDNPLLATLRELAAILGRERALGDAVFERFFRDGKPVLHPLMGGGVGVANLAATCVLASPRAARACIEALRAGERDGSLHVIEGTRELLAAAAATLDGNTRSAADAARVAAQQRWFVVRTADFLAGVFDAAKELDLADQVDRDRMGTRGELNGANLAVLRAARRAAARGDRTRARELAGRVVEAWKLADAPVPSVEEMRTLAAP